MALSTWWARHSRTGGHATASGIGRILDLLMNKEHGVSGGHGVEIEVGMTGG